jgi:macrodomain Ter protein organizer (MatP/YcbG family)
MAARKTTSIKVDPNLWRELKIMSIRQNKDISDQIENMIKQMLRRRK